jgi:hypothetical protein
MEGSSLARADPKRAHIFRDIRKFTKRYAFNAICRY